MRRRRHTESADTVVAATAGLGNWKTWAGRSHGDDRFEYLDLVRGAKRKFLQTFLQTTPPSGSTCPVCFCQPEAANEWHITSSCGHAVCIDCLQMYAANLVQDREHSGPLKCPVCPMPLRPKDAIVALAGNHALVRQWDDKIRDQFLRALPSYRSCPKCNNKNEGNNSSLGGGGFVTPECLLPYYEQREAQAMRALRLLPLASAGMVFLFLGYCIFISHFPSQSVLADMIFIILPIPICDKLVLQCQAFLAFRARRALWEPIPVECPCCDDSFVLSAQNEFSPETNIVLADDKTSKWMQSHTLPCPSCSVPIVKSGGCNHMRCSHCRASFCWACMQLRTRCRAYQCTNGGRNVVPLDASNVTMQVAAEDSNSTLLTRLEYLERKRVQGALTTRDAGIILSSLLLRHSSPVQFIANCVGSATTLCFRTVQFIPNYVGSATTLFFRTVQFIPNYVGSATTLFFRSKLIWAICVYLVIVYLVFVAYTLNTWIRRNNITPGRPANPHSLMAEYMAMNMTEEQMLAAALSNSRKEQMRAAEQMLEEQMIALASANSRRER
jgi:hypothetical protein